MKGRGREAAGDLRSESVERQMVLTTCDRDPKMDWGSWWLMTVVVGDRGATGDWVSRIY